MTFKLAGLLLIASSLHSASYIVSGTIVDSRSHSPLANARVSLAPTEAREQKLEQITKQDGKFSFIVTQAGKYSLQVIKPGYPGQTYRQAGFSGVASAIVVRDDQDTSHIIFPAMHGAAIYGQIVDENSDPVPKALVEVFQSLVVGGERKVVARRQIRADATGRYRIAGLLSGNYYICAMGRPWFADSLIQLEQMQQNLASIQAGVQVTDDNQPSSDDKQEPVQHKEQQEQQFETPKFSPDPAFRGTAFLTTFYPSAPTVQEASLVHLDVGEEVQISINLPLAKAVSVKCTLSLSGTPGDGRARLFKKIYDQYMLFLEEWVLQTTTFEFKNVPPGSYEIIGASQASSGPSSWNIRQDIEVGTSDMDVTLKPPPLGSVLGRVSFESQPAKTPINLFVSLRDERGIIHRAEVDGAGNFLLNRLPLGRYEVTGGNTDYLAAYFKGPDGQPLPLTLDVTSGEPMHRDLVLTRASSLIEGTVEKSGEPHVGAFVLLMPVNPAQRWAYRVDQTDSDGSYRLATIPPGDYFLIALTNGETVAYRDPRVAAVLAKFAKPVHVDATGHLTMKLDLTDTDALPPP